MLARDDLVDEAAIFRKVVEVGRSAHQQRVAHRRLQMPVRALDRTIFLRNTAVIAGRLHPVMATQRVISVRQILARRCIQIPERRRQTVAAIDRKSTRLNSSHSCASRMPSSACKQKSILLSLTY